MFKAGKVVGVQIALATDRQADAVHGNRKAFGKVAQLRNRAAAVAHVVFGMDFQPAKRAGASHDVAVVPGLVADAGTWGQGGVLRGVEHGKAPLGRGV